MSTKSLPPELAATLRACEFTYSAVGASRKTSMPLGFRTFENTVQVGSGVSFAAAREDLLQWQLQRRAGFQVSASSSRIEVDAVAVLALGVGPFKIRSPVRVVYVIDEPDRCGFAYGTLPSHPASGEECFLLERDALGTVSLTVRAFSRPGTWWSRLLRPAVSGTQRLVTSRYLRTFH